VSINWYLPPLFVALSMLAHFALFEEVLGRTSAALAALMLHVVYCLSTVSRPDLPGYILWERIAEDKIVAAFVLLPVALTFTLRHLRGDRRAWRLLLPSVLSLAITHLVVAVLYVLLVGTLLLLRLPAIFRDRRDLRPALALLGIALLALVPALVQRVATPGGDLKISFDVAATMPRYFTLWRSRHVLLLGGSWFVVSPAFILQPLMLAALAATLLLVRRVKTDLSAQYLVAGMLLVACLYFPPAALVLGRLMTPWQLWLITWLAPVSCSIVYAVAGLGNHPGDARWLAGWTAACVVLAAIALVVALRGRPDGILTSRFSLTSSEPAESFRAAEAFLETGVPRGSIVLANPQLSKLLPAYVGGLRVVWSPIVELASLIPIDAQSLSELDARRAALELAFSERGKPCEALRRYAADYVVAAAGEQPRFDRSPRTFRLVFSNPDFYVYRVDAAREDCLDDAK
jgi:hypothetical protein